MINHWVSCGCVSWIYW